MPNSVRLHRVFRASPDRIYKAFVDADALVRWLPPNGFTGRVHAMDAREGGGYRMSFTNFSTGHSRSFEEKYVKLAPGELLTYTDRFDDPNLQGEMHFCDPHESRRRYGNQHSAAAVAKDAHPSHW